MEKKSLYSVVGKVNDMLMVPLRRQMEEQWLNTWPLKLFGFTNSEHVHDFQNKIKYLYLYRVSEFTL